MRPYPSQPGNPRQLRKQPPQRLRTLPLQQLSWRLIWNSLKNAVASITFWRFLKGFALIFLILPLTVYVIRELNRDVLIIDPFIVPKQLADAGLTPEAMANRVGDRLRAMETETKTSLKKDAMTQQAEETSIPEVEIPGTKLGLKTIVDVGRNLFHLYPKHIGGDIVLPLQDASQVSTNSPGGLAKVTVYFRQERNGSQSLSTDVDRDDVDAMVQQAAELALEQINPYVLAVNCRDHGKFDHAIELAREMTEDPSQDVLHREAAWDLWGLTLNDERRYDEAIAKYLKASTLDPKFALTYNSWGIALYNEGKDDEAIAKYQKAIKWDPKSVVAYDDWGVALVHERKYDEAIAKFEKASTLDPKFALTYYDWGLALDAQGKDDEAIAKFQTAIELDPRSALAYYGWSVALYRKDKKDEAMAMHEKAFELDPTSALDYNDLGNALEDERKDDEAIAKYQKAIELDPTSALAYNGWGSALYHEGKIDEAIAKYEKATELDPKYALAYNNWGNALDDEGKYDEAIAKYQKAIGLDSTSALAYNGWGSALYHEGKIDEAIAKYEKAIELDPKYALAYNNWGNTLDRMGKKAEAEEKFAEAKRLSAQN